MWHDFLQRLQTILTWLWGQGESILSGIIASIIIIIFAEMYGLGHLVVRNARDRKVWKLRNPKELRIISGSVTSSNPFIQAPTAWPDANAASILIQKCKLIYPKARVTHSFKCALDELTGDVIAVGGPVHNEATREFIRRIDDYLSFHSVGRTQTEEYYSMKVQGNTYSPEYDNDRIYRDFGAIVRMRNPLRRYDNDVILVIGCDTFGVLAAALVLADDDVARSARRDLEKHIPIVGGVSDFVAVFSCEPLEYAVGAIQFEKLYRFEDAS